MKSKGIMYANLEKQVSKGAFFIMMTTSGDCPSMFTAQFCYGEYFVLFLEQ